MGVIRDINSDAEGGLVTVETAVRILQNHGVVAIPTETVYGLAACAKDDIAVTKVFATKGRPANNPLIVHVSSAQQATQFAHFTALALQLAEKFWPGPLTLVLPHRDNLPVSVTCGLSTVAVRMPRHPVALQIIEHVGQPLVAPSANRSGTPSPTSAQHVLNDYGGTIPVVDGGASTIGIESTVVMVSDASCTILRPGAITGDELLEAGCNAVHLLGNAEDLHHSPGTRYRHYAPKTPIRLLFSEDDVKIASRSGNKHILAPYTLADQPQWRLLSTASLYSELRLADALGVDEIIVLCTEAVIKDSALIDRLRRAAGNV